MPFGVEKSTYILRSPTVNSPSALIGTPMAASAIFVNGECGTGTCQAVSGVEWWALAAPEVQLTTYATLLLPAPEVDANSMHYGDPAMCHEVDVQAVQGQGVFVYFGSPKCTSYSFPWEVPFGVTAKSTCPLGSPTGNSPSALICTRLAARASGVNGEWRRYLQGRLWCRVVRPCDSTGPVDDHCHNVLAGPEG